MRSARLFSERRHNSREEPSARAASRREGDGEPGARGVCKAEGEQGRPGDVVVGMQCCALSCWCH